MSQDRHEQLSLFDQASFDQKPRAATKSIDLFTMQQVNTYRAMNAQLFCTCADSPRAQISVIRYSQGAFQVKVTGASYLLTPARVWAEEPSQAATEEPKWK